MADEQNQNQSQQQPQASQNQNQNPEERKEVNPSRLTQQDIDSFLQNEQARSAPQDILLQWDAPEFQQVARPQQWYILFALAGIGLVIYAIFTANYLFALLIVILAIVLNQYFNRKPDTIKVGITREGIVVNNRFYAYDADLASFWILYNPPELKTINFAHRSSVQPDIVIQLEDQNPLKIREILLNYLPEDIEKEEHPVDTTFRRWGF